MLNDLELPDYIKPFLESEEMKRIKEIDMNCGMKETSVPLFLQADEYSRYTHSVNAAKIVHHFTHDKAQTLSALFHDIATPTFSHVIDFLHHDQMQQEDTESLTHQFLAQSKTIPLRLKQLNLTIEQVDNYHLYTIADNDSPKLSSDRLEYTLGSLLTYHFATSQDLEPIFNDLCVSKNEYGEDEIVFQHRKYASLFAKYALQCGNIYSSKEDRYCMQLLANILQQAQEEGILSEEQFYTTENNVITILKHSKLSLKWHDFNQIKGVVSSHEPKEGFLQINVKRRYIDPYCLETKQRVSQYDEEVRSQQQALLNAKYDEYLKGIK